MNDVSARRYRNNQTQQSTPKTVNGPAAVSSPSDSPRNPADPPRKPVHEAHAPVSLGFYAFCCLDPASDTARSKQIPPLVALADCVAQQVFGHGATWAINVSPVERVPLLSRIRVWKLPIAPSAKVVQPRRVWRLAVRCEHSAVKPDAIGSGSAPFSVRQSVSVVVLNRVPQSSPISKVRKHVKG